MHYPRKFFPGVDLQDWDYEVIAKKLGYGPNIKALTEMGCIVHTDERGRVTSVERPQKPATALERAIERELVPEWYVETRETYLELQRAYASVYEARCDSLYAVRGGDGDGEGARRWILLMKKVGRSKPFILCDWGFHRPPRQGEHLADYAEAFDVIDRGLRAVREELAEAQDTQQNACA